MRPTTLDRLAEVKEELEKVTGKEIMTADRLGVQYAIHTAFQIMIYEALQDVIENIQDLRSDMNSNHRN